MIPRRVRKPMPLRGRRTAWPPDSIGPEYTPNCLNVRFRFGEARGAPGRGLLSGPTAAEQVRSISQFARIDGTTVWPLLLTDTKLFRWGYTTPSTPSQWHRVQGDFTPVGGRIYTTAVGEDHFFFCNGNDLIAQWDGTVPNGHFKVIAVADGGILPKSKFIEYFNNRIHGASNFESGTTFANRIRWSQNGDFTKWNDTNGLGAGFLDISDERNEPIRGIRSINGELAIYTRHSIKHMIPTGTLDPTYIVITRSRGIGCDAPYTIASAGQMHFFLGYDHNVWMWDGQTATPIGFPIWEELTSLITPTGMDSYFGTVSFLRGEYWLVIGTDVFVYDYLRGSWSRDSFPNLTALGEIEEALPSYTWLTVPGIWSTIPGNWQFYVAPVMTTLFGGRQDGATMIVDDSVVYDYFAIGSIMDRFLETEDMYLGYSSALDNDPMRQGVVLRMLLTYQFVNSNPFEVGISTDRGSTWLTQQIIPNTKGLSLIDWIVTGETIRFRFRENNALGAFRWRNYEYEWNDAGDYSGSV